MKINKYISFVCHLTKCYFLISCIWKKICTCRVFLDGNTPANNFVKIKLLLLGKLLSCGRDMSEDKLVLGCERGKLVLYDQHRKASRPAKSSLVCTTSKMYNTTCIVLSLWQKNSHCLSLISWFLFPFDNVNVYLHYIDLDNRAIHNNPSIFQF